MGLIFMDIDGVLNDMASLQSLAFEPRINQIFVAPFNRIIEQTGADLVITSTWRGHIIEGDMTIAGFNVLLRSHGVRGQVIGHTRETLRDDDSVIGSRNEPRWHQIADWIRDNTREEFYRYCILDDDPNAFGGRPGVQTNGRGLTWHDAEMAIEILQG